MDNLDFLESGNVVDEFRRATQFEGVLFLSGPVLNDEDIDGIYDDFMKSGIPPPQRLLSQGRPEDIHGPERIHLYQGHMDHFPADLALLAAHLAPFRPAESADPMRIVEERREQFTGLYALKARDIRAVLHRRIQKKKAAPATRTL